MENWLFFALAASCFLFYNTGDQSKGAQLLSMLAFQCNCIILTGSWFKPRIIWFGWEHGVGYELVDWGLDGVFVCISLTINPIHLILNSAWIHHTMLPIDICFIKIELLLVKILLVFIIPCCFGRGTTSYSMFSITIYQILISHQSMTLSYVLSSGSSQLE